MWESVWGELKSGKVCWGVGEVRRDVEKGVGEGRGKCGGVKKFGEVWEGVWGECGGCGGR